MFAKAGLQPLLLHFRNGRAAAASRNEEFHQHGLIHGRKLHRRVGVEKVMHAVIFPLVVEQIKPGTAYFCVQAFSAQKAVYLAGFKNAIRFPARKAAQIFIQKAFELLFVLHALQIL